MAPASRETPPARHRTCSSSSSGSCRPRAFQLLRLPRWRPTMAPTARGSPWHCYRCLKAGAFLWLFNRFGGDQKLRILPRESSLSTRYMATARLHLFCPILLQYPLSTAGSLSNPSVQLLQSNTKAACFPHFRSTSSSGHRESA